MNRRRVGIGIRMEWNGMHKKMKLGKAGEKMRVK